MNPLNRFASGKSIDEKYYLTQLFFCNNIKIKALILLQLQLRLVLRKHIYFCLSEV